jgi:hypothetical protein
MPNSISLSGATPGRGGSFRPLRDRRQTQPRIPEIVNVEASLWSRSIGLALTAGLGVLLAPTSDQGAISVTVYDGDDRRRSYAGSREELQDALEAIEELAAERGV